MFVARSNRPTKSLLSYPHNLMNSISGKILERPLNSRRHYFLRSDSSFHPKRFGFAHGKSALLLLYAFRRTLGEIKGKKLHASLTSLDFKSAFGIVLHPSVLKFLRPHNCSRFTCHQLTKYFLERRTVVYRSSVSEA